MWTDGRGLDGCGLVVLDMLVVDCGLIVLNRCDGSFFGVSWRDQNMLHSFFYGLYVAVHYYYVGVWDSRGAPPTVRSPISTEFCISGLSLYKASVHST